MMRKSHTNGLSSMNGSSAAAGDVGSRDFDWELRPGGMLVQKRTEEKTNMVPLRMIKVRVKYKSTYHEITINSQASFGELKKMLTGPTGLHHQDQKLLYKDKERDSKEFLDLVRVKDKSKIVLVEDPISQERRYLEMRKNAKMERAAKLVSEVSLEIDRLAVKVSELESIISNGGKVEETDVLALIELLMNQLLRLDGVMADGDVKLQRKMQVKRVQQYVETLDMLKVKISMPSTNRSKMSVRSRHKQSNGQRLPSIQEQEPEKTQEKHSNRKNAIQNVHKHSNGTSFTPNRRQQWADLVDVAGDQQQQQQLQSHSTSGTVVTTQWETFDSTPASPIATSTSTSNPANKNSIHPNFSWDLL